MPLPIVPAPTTTTRLTRGGRSETGADGTGPAPQHEDGDHNLAQIAREKRQRAEAHRALRGPRENDELREPAQVYEHDAGERGGDEPGRAPGSARELAHGERGDRIREQVPARGAEQPRDPRQTVRSEDRETRRPESEV